MKKIKLPILETERLLLRMWSKKDAEELYSYAKNPNVGPAAGWKPHESVGESKQIIETVFLNNMAWAVVDKKSGRVIGSIGFEADKYRPNINSKEMGYSLAEEYWGKGLMTEAAKTLIKYGFEVLNLDVIMIGTSENNMRSRRVIEKCGFTYEGTLRRAYRIYDNSIKEVRCYSMLREEYRFLADEKDGGPHV